MPIADAATRSCGHDTPGPGNGRGNQFIEETVMVRLDSGGEADQVVLPATRSKIIGGKPSTRPVLCGRGIPLQPVKAETGPARIASAVAAAFRPNCNF
jgi:hypothetical protein